MPQRCQPLGECSNRPDNRERENVILTKDLAQDFWNDRVMLTRCKAPPSDSRYGRLDIGTAFTVKKVEIEERTGLYRFPYVPSLGGKSYSGLTSVGMMSYACSPLPEPMQIGRYCSISNGLALLDSQHPTHTVTTSILTFRKNNPICSDITTAQVAKDCDFHVRGHKAWPKIGHDVWIGRDVTLALGITIGTGAIVAAGAMVTKDVEPYSVVAGNPARHIKYRLADASLRSALLETEWWEYHPSDLVRLGLGNPAVFVERLQAERRDGAIRRYRPTTYLISGDAVERRAGSYED